MMSDIEISEKLKKWYEKRYPHGDNFYTRKDKNGEWFVGYTNDYPLQHGNGFSSKISNKVLNCILNDEDTSKYHNYSGTFDIKTIVTIDFQSEKEKITVNGRNKKEALKNLKKELAKLRGINTEDFC